MTYERLGDWEMLIKNKKTDLGVIMCKMKGKNDTQLEPLWLCGFDETKELIFTVDSSADMYKLDKFYTLNVLENFYLHKTIEEVRELSVDYDKKY